MNGETVWQYFWVWDENAKEYRANEPPEGKALLLKFDCCKVPVVGFFRKHKTLSLSYPYAAFSYLWDMPLHTGEERTTNSNPTHWADCLPENPPKDKTWHS